MPMGSSRKNEDEDEDEAEAQQALPRNAAELADKLQPESRFHVSIDLWRFGRG